jgi:hypothetical protein
MERRVGRKEERRREEGGTREGGSRETPRCLLRGAQLKEPRGEETEEWLWHAAHPPDERHLRRPSTHVVQDHVLGLVGKVPLDAVLQGGGRVGVDQAHDVEARQAGRLDQGLPLRQAEEGWHGDD